MIRFVGNVPFFIGRGKPLVFFFVREKRLEKNPEVFFSG